MNLNLSASVLNALLLSEENRREEAEGSGVEAPGEDDFAPLLYVRFFTSETLP